MSKDSQIDISLAFGDQTDEEQLLSFSLQLKYEGKLTEQKIDKLKIQEKSENDCHVFIKFQVPTKTQKEAIDYLQMRMDESQKAAKEYIPPLQKFLKHPKQKGNVNFSSKQEGKVELHYCFFKERLFGEKQSQFIQKLLKELKKSNLPSSLDISVKVRGQQINLIKQTTELSANYIEASLKLKQLSIPLIKQIVQALSSKTKLQRKFQKSPISSMLLFGLKKIKLNYKFNPFRKIIELYREGAEKPYKPSPQKYVIRDLLDQKIELDLYFFNLFHMTGEIKFKNEAALQRFLQTSIHPILKMI